MALVILLILRSYNFSISLSAKSYNFNIGLAFYLWLNGISFSSCVGLAGTSTVPSRTIVLYTSGISYSLGLLWSEEGYFCRCRLSVSPCTGSQSTSPSSFTLYQSFYPQVVLFKV